MRIDCSKTENYFLEKSRMTNGCECLCSECPLYQKNNGKNITCGRLQDYFTKEAIEIVQRWSDEHPIKTILDDFVEKYPDAPMRGNGTPHLCPHNLGYERGVCVDCIDCWTRPISQLNSIK